MAISRSKTTPANAAIAALDALRASDLEMNQEDHKEVYDHIAHSVLPSLQPGAACPPLHVVIYAARNIMFPTLLCHLIPYLLELVAHIECVRKTFLTQIDKLLTWDDFYKHEHYKRDDISVLEQNDRDFVENLTTTSNEEMRHTYRSIVNGFSQLHIYETWFSPKCAEIDGLMKRYFPSREDRENTMVLDLIHHDLSNHELQELSEAENKCLDLLERYVRDEERRDTVDPLSRKAREVYPPLVDKRELVRLTQLYLEHLETAIERTQDILGSSE